MKSIDIEGLIAACGKYDGRKVNYGFEFSANVVLAPAKLSDLSLDRQQELQAVYELAYAEGRESRKQKSAGNRWRPPVKRPRQKKRASKLNGTKGGRPITLPF